MLADINKTILYNWLLDTFDVLIICCEIILRQYRKVKQIYTERNTNVHVLRGEFKVGEGYYVINGNLLNLVSSRPCWS